jgi:hypothetical protein
MFQLIHTVMSMSLVAENYMALFNQLKLKMQTEIDAAEERKRQLLRGCDPNTGPPLFSFLLNSLLMLNLGIGLS